MTAEPVEKGAQALLPIADTASGKRAGEAPEEVLAQYDRLVERLWIPPRLESFADGILGSVAAGKSTWASLSGPYGFGKTAAGLLVWRHARSRGFLAVPPLSCTRYDEFAGGIAALAAAQVPKQARKIRALFDEVWGEGIDRIARTEAKRFDIPVRKLRNLLQDQLRAGCWTPDGHSHRLVEFLARLGQLAGTWGSGLVVVVDELQQLLGPLDVNSLSRLREFIWGMRTEQSPCAVVLSLDSQLEARMGQWAADLLHRVREHSPTLLMTGVFTRVFPAWLWDRLASPGNGRARPDRSALSPAVLASLGQFVERPDLANGPRTVVDVFSRALAHFEATGAPYGLSHLVEDLHQGRFRFFGEGAPVQRLLTQLLSDDWIRSDPAREGLVRALAAFPRGCPADIIHAHVGNGRTLKTARDELFGPLLVELPEGLALEQLQQVARGASPWEQALARCWDTMPGAPALAECAPELVSRVLLPRLFPGLDAPGGAWSTLPADAQMSVSGFQIFRGGYDGAYPLREVAVWVGDREPSAWPEDVDLCVALLCDSVAAVGRKPTASIANLSGTPRILLSMPILVPLDANLPSELSRYQKYIQPEPIRPAYVLAALRDHQACMSPSGEKNEGSDRSQRNADASAGAETDQVAAVRRLEAFQEVCTDFLLRVLIQGEVDLGMGRPVPQSGLELLRSLVTQACRSRYPDYRTLMTARHWQSLLETYRGALQCDALTPEQRRGQAAVTLAKADAYLTLFGQSSTAAGDSLVRSFGPLAEVATAGDGWSMRFSLHPAEATLLRFLRETARKRGIEREAAFEYLRHRGYVAPEVEEVITLLLARDLVTADGSGRLRVVADRAGLIEAMRTRLAELCTQLVRLGGDEHGGASDQDGPAGLQRRVAELERALAVRLDAARQERQAQREALLGLIGRVREIALPHAWRSTDLITHLSSIGEALGRSQSQLLQGLRRELSAVDGDLAAAAPVTLDWALRWRRRREAATRAVAKLESRTGEFQSQCRALICWEPVNDRLYASRTVCDKVAASDPAPARELDRLLARWRERFATQTWEPLHAAVDFARDIEPIERQVQGLLYSQATAYYRELESLREQFGTHLPRGLPPAFDRPGGDAAPGYASFQALYVWAIAGLRAVLTDAVRRKEAGEPWSDPRQKRRSWNEVVKAAERLLPAVDDPHTLKQVELAGARLREVLSGFRGDSVFDDPGRAPDFDALRERYVRGEVVIRIEPRP